MFRLFVGIPLPEPVSSMLAGLNGGLPGARWVTEENLHITLRFIGEVGREDAEDLHRLLERVHAPAFELTVTGIGCFETRGKIHTLWAGVARADRLNFLQDRVEATVVRAGYEPERRKFKPHITLARFRNGSGERIGSFLKGNNALAIGPFQVDRFTLFRSFLGREGAHYEALADYPLESA